MSCAARARPGRNPPSWTPPSRTTKRGTKRGPRALAALAVTFLSASAQAEPPTNDARAEQLFRSGEKKFDSGDYPAACEDFFQSLKLGPKLGTLLNLALCHETVGKPVTAWHEYSHAAAWAAQNNQRDRYDFAMHHVRGLEPKLPRVVLQLPSEHVLESLDLDGEPLPEQRWYMPLFLDPGEHRLAVTAPGKQRTAVAFRVTTSPGDQVVYIPRLPDAVLPPKPAPPPKPNPMRRSLGIAGLAFGGAAMAVGGTFGVLAATTNERDPAVNEQATVSTVAFLGGAALAAAGGWALWTSVPRGTTVAAAPGRDGASLSFSTTF